MDRAHVVSRTLHWYAHHARPLPWRDDVSPWAVLVSEVMLQQTPVARVQPVWEAWIERWPDPTSLADDDPAEAVRAWGRLGYPRRARRLHEAATTIRDEHQGVVPHSFADLLALPGVGSYTAAAVASFAFGQRHLVLDTNVRRVLARLDDGVAFPPPSLTRSEQARALEWVPEDAEDAAAWAAASMELGALVCVATSPSCDSCPVRDACAWHAAGQPAGRTTPARTDLRGDRPPVPGCSSRRSPVTHRGHRSAGAVGCLAIGSRTGRTVPGFPDQR